MAMVNIRKATSQDEAALADLNWRSWTPVAEIAPRPPRDATFFGGASEPEHYLVAELDNRLVGYLRLVQPIPVPSAAHVRQIQGLAVDEEFRGHGIGTDLLERAFAEARGEGATRLTLRVLAPNTDARRLYERMGFTVEGTLHHEFLIDGTYVDDILMARAI
ncbi:GNAT family N-acetyltransferase [Nocardia sp. NPDC050175]|uniref:GNAT family N-acetyltransferase n=1 Tax=Nocardia sp. NPDC050175 TaxID=3364317 RepID=UPI003792A518